MTISRLKELEAAATPGPWRRDDRSGWHYPTADAVVIDEPLDGRAMPTAIIRPDGDSPGDVSCTVGKFEREQANAKFIAALRNAAPALIAVAEAADAFRACYRDEAKSFELKAGVSWQDVRRAYDVMDAALAKLKEVQAS